MEVDINKVPNENLSTEKILYSESQSRFILSIDPKHKEEFERLINGLVFAEVGVVTTNEFIIHNAFNSSIQSLTEVYRERFKDC